MKLNFNEKVTVMTALTFYRDELKKHENSPIAPVELATVNDLLKKVSDEVTEDVKVKTDTIK